LAKREVDFEGRTYKVRSDKVEIPDLTKISRIAALTWLCQETYPRGHSTKRPNPLAGLGGAITIGVRGS
jgi:hypothetical protein